MIHQINYTNPKTTNILYRLIQYRLEIMSVEYFRLHDVLCFAGFCTLIHIFLMPFFTPMFVVAGRVGRQH